MNNLAENLKMLSAKDGLEVLIAQHGEIDFERNKIKIKNPESLHPEPIHKGEQFDVLFDYEGDSFLLKKVGLHSEKQGELELSPAENVQGKLLYGLWELNSNLTNDKETTLDSVIAPIPWEESFNFTTGVDAITGETKATALEKIDVRLHQGKDAQESYQFIQNKEDYERFIKVSVSGKYNISGVDISGSASFTNKIEFSSICTTLVADYQSVNNEYDEPAGSNDYRFTEKALKIMQESTGKFREVYGDYFVAGIKRASRFTALYKCTATTSKKLNEFTASFGVDSPGVFSVNAAAEFKEAASKYGIRIDVEVYYYGVLGNSPITAPWTPEKVIEALAWFKEHESPKPVNVKLQHYNTIDPGYPLEIKIAPVIFAELSFLFQQLWVITTQFNSCPRFYTDSFKERYVLFTRGLSADKVNLVIDENLRAFYKEEANNLSEKLQDILVRQAFYFKVKDQQEPAKGEHKSAVNGVPSWLYGINSSTDDAVVLSSQELNYAARASSLAWVKRKHTFNFGSNDLKSEWLIVGWEVLSHWKDGTNGGWEKASDHIIGKKTASVLVESQKGRGCSWGIKVFYVNGADYRFG